MKKFGIMWWLEVVGAIVIGIIGAMAIIDGADALTIGMLAVVEVLLVLDILTSLMKGFCNSNRFFLMFF